MTIDQPFQSLYAMLRIRRVEEALAERYGEQEMRCPMHLCIGQEAIAVGVSEAMKADDLVFSNHRAHGHYLAKGGDLNAMVAELYGKASGCCGGRGGSMHLIDQACGFMGATPIVGGTIPLAVGAAWGAALRGTGQVTTVYFGDGCFEEGVMHESLNYAALHKLPILFVCENNQFSVYTKLGERQPERPIYRIAEAHGLTAATGNGNDIAQVRDMAATAIGNIRAGRGPQFLELHTYRWREHCGPNFDDELNYRSTEEVEAGKSDCPIVNHIEALRAQHANMDDTLDQFEAVLSAEIQAAFDFAFVSREPAEENIGNKVYA